MIAFSLRTFLLSVCIANMIGPNSRSGNWSSLLPDTLQSSNHIRSMPPRRVPGFRAHPVSRISCSSGGDDPTLPALETSAMPPVSQFASTTRASSSMPSAVSARNVRLYPPADGSASSERSAPVSNAPVTTGADSSSAPMNRRPSVEIPQLSPTPRTALSR